MNVFVKKITCLLILFSQGAFASHAKSSVQKNSIIATVPEALLSIRQVINNVPRNDSNAMQVYEKEQAGVLVKCAKVLYDNACAQVLSALQEINSRKVYWQYQKNHPWVYFRSKNPLKWVTGQTQDVEIKNNLEQLESHQGELYVLLGQLVQHGNVYDHEYKTVFVADYTKAYAWIDRLLDLLPRLAVDIKKAVDSSSFVARALQVRLKLEKVRRFKNQILAGIAETKIPTHLERNWFKYGVMMYLFGQGYNRADQISKWALTSFDSSKSYLTSVAVPIKETFFPGSSSKGALIIQEGNINEARLAMKNFLNVMEQKNIITAQEKAAIIADEQAGSSIAFQNLLNTKIMTSAWNKIRYAVEGWSIFIQLLALHGGGNIEQEITGIRNIALLAPVGVIGWAGYSGLRNVYHNFAAPDYSVIRQTLFDIKSLFVDQTKPLDDEGYGKMIYLLYDLKQRAEKELPFAVRAEFLHDIDKIELQEFDVAAKRRIVEDMFKKYSFLKLV